MTLSLQPVPHLPQIRPGDDLASIIYAALQENSLALNDGDILVLAQKIVSKAEGRLFNLTEVEVSPEAAALAQQVEKDPRFVELVLRESKSVVRMRTGVLIVEHRQGFICANAGIDHSNVQGPWGSPEDWVLLLPEDADASARAICEKLQQWSGAQLGILIIDSHGRAWRNGITGVTIGTANVPGIVDMRGQPDMFGFQLRVTTIAAADELAAAASLVMGQAAEGMPVVHVSGFPYPLREASLQELLRPRHLDLFR